MIERPTIHLPDEIPCDACRGTGRVEVQGEITTYPGRLVRCHACRGLGAKKEPTMTHPDKPTAAQPSRAERIEAAAFDADRYAGIARDAGAFGLERLLSSLATRLHALALPPDAPAREYGVAWMREQIKRRWSAPCVSGSEQMHERDRWLDDFLLTHRATTINGPDAPAVRVDERWRNAIADALGIDPDPANHDPSWARDAVREIREIGNRPARQRVDDAAVEREAFTVAALAVEKHRREIDGDHEGPSGSWLGTWDRLRAKRRAMYEALLAAERGGDARREE